MRRMFRIVHHGSAQSVLARSRGDWKGRAQNIVAIKEYIWGRLTLGEETCKTTSVHECLPLEREAAYLRRDQGRETAGLCEAHPGGCMIISINWFQPGQAHRRECHTGWTRWGGGEVDVGKV
jgi:hypothetical protein